MKVDDLPMKYIEDGDFREHTFQLPEGIWYVPSIVGSIAGIFTSLKMV